MARDILFTEELKEILRTLIGEGPIKLGGRNQRYEKGDVMKYKSGSKWYLYKCKVSGEYSIPEETKFKRIDFRG